MNPIFCTKSVLAAARKMSENSEPDSVLSAMSPGFGAVMCRARTWEELALGSCNIRALSPYGGDIVLGWIRGRGNIAVRVGAVHRRRPHRCCKGPGEKDTKNRYRFLKDWAQFHMIAGPRLGSSQDKGFTTQSLRKRHI